MEMAKYVRGRVTNIRVNTVDKHTATGPCVLIIRILKGET